MTEFYFMNGEYVDASKAMIPVRTHAFLYGTAVFEGIRAYWNEEEKQLCAWKVLIQLKNTVILQKNY